MKIEHWYFTAEFNPAEFGQVVCKAFDHYPEAPLSDEAKWNAIRKVRDILLDQIDTRQGNAEKWQKLPQAKRDEITTYKQQLRDIPQNFPTPESVSITEIPN